MFYVTRTNNDRASWPLTTDQNDMDTNKKNLVRQLPEKKTTQNMVGCHENVLAETSNCHVQFSA